ncbi:hypothetical protein N665_0065s0009 [Sinapis alba]|nr:hypothetical protein N665_0065s0009 [Sinapis alba]
MAATLLARCCSPISYNCDACKRVSSQTNENRNLVTSRRFSKPARLILHNRNDPSLTRALRDFADSGLMEEALHLFDEMNKSDTFSWNMMIKGFTSCGLYHEALSFYSRMVFTGIKADSFTYPFVIKSAAGVSLLFEGKTIHATVIKLGFDSDVYVCNSLISFYMKLGCAWDAEKVFDEMPERDIVSWNSMASGYLAVGDGLMSLTLFREMMKCGFGPDRFSIMSGLGACCRKMGKEIHCYAIRSGIEAGDDVMVLTSILDMYSRFGEVSYAERVFNGMSNKNIVAWNVMIGCYARNGRVVDAFLCFQKMSEENGLRPDVITLINLLHACEILEGRAVHGHATRRGFLPHVVLETALIDMYGECGELKSAEVVFDRMGEKNLLSWNSMIAAYVQNGENYSALELFQELWDSSSLVPDSTTFASILPAYAESLSLSEGRKLHGYIVKARYDGSNTIILNSLVHMYAMCGDLEDARKCFDQVVFKDVVSWNSIIMAYAVHGFGRMSICLFSEMMITGGISPNKSTFASLLAACSISGMIDEGWDHFNSMKREYGIDPGIEHYVYMLDLIGRTGNLSLAKRFIEEMPFVPTARVWGSLLKASRNHNDITMAEFAAEQVLKMEHDNTGCYVLLLNMYSEAGRWEDIERIKLLMKSQGVSRTTSRSTVETKGRTHVFTNGDRSHVETNKIYEVLDIVSRMVEEKEDSYVHCVSKMRPETLLKKKSNSHRRHSIRLATCLGLISTETGRVVMVRNNTRICRRCHEFLEKASKVTRREIVVGDSKIFHHFSNGCCSCGNYW